MDCDTLNEFSVQLLKDIREAGPDGLTLAEMHAKHPEVPYSYVATDVFPLRCQGLVSVAGSRAKGGVYVASRRKRRVEATRPARPLPEKPKPLSLRERMRAR